ncbi:MAG: MBL fold metallo-hydrolase [Clostridia bacterium]|nr:MBL fold metallo-hydrolase [Clostridia bacterium]MDE6371930.1 MBL fold metallo-hydrolase [Clostridia bacterium]
MKITTFVLGLLSNNTYLVENQEEKTCFIVDPSTESDKLTDYIDGNNLKLEGILLTHGHFDHIGGVARLKEKYGAKVFMHKMDIDFIDNPLDFGRKYTRFDVDETVEDGEEITLCSHKIKVLHTPGHSQGGVCYICDGVIFCGDTLFRDGYGRFDLRGGDFATLQNSIKKIFEIQGDYVLLCGHGPSTTLDYERAHNEIY